MYTMFDRLDVWFNDEKGANKPFMFAVKDSDDVNNNFSLERWVFAWMSLEEAEKVYKFLGDHIESCKREES